MKATPLESAIDAVVELLAVERKKSEAGGKTCRRCKASVSLLVHDPEKPSDPVRQVCGECAGKSNREQIDNLRPRKGDAPHETARKDGWR